MSTLDLKLKLADAVRATDRARSTLAVRRNNLEVARIDVTHAKLTLTRRREDEAALRRQLREQDALRRGRK